MLLFLHLACPRQLASSGIGSSWYKMSTANGGAYLELAPRILGSLPH